MAHLVVTVRAAPDAADIFERLTDTAGTNVAMRYRREIDTLHDRLSLFPRSGMRRPSLGRDVRIGVVWPYVAIHEHRSDTVTVLRVLDGRRNITRRLVRE